MTTFNPRRLRFCFTASELLSISAAIKHKIRELIEKEPTVDKLDRISLKIKELYENGRKASLKEEEFRKIFESNL